MKKKIFFIISSIFIFVIILVSSNFGNRLLFPVYEKLPDKIKLKLVETIFVYKNQEVLKQKLENKNKIIKKNKVYNQKKNDDIEKSIIKYNLNFDKENETKIKIEKNEYTLKKFKSFQLAKSINAESKGSAYIEYNNGKLFLMSASGIITFSSDIENDQIQFKYIKTNIDDFVNFKEFNTTNDKNEYRFSIKDFLIFKDKIFVSFTNKVSEDCYNISIIYGKLHLDKINFEKFFFPNECVLKKNIDNEFNAHQSGGRLAIFDNKNILLSTGEFRHREKSQDAKSIFGKILLINIESGNRKLISMGHRNPQGMFFDQQNKRIITSEHGPYGGDEININNKPLTSIKNYGWPVSSYGDHYGGKNAAANKKKYKKYPLKKSHEKFGFEEPHISFYPSIGISQIINFNKDEILISSLKEKALFLLKLNEKFYNNNENFYSIDVSLGDDPRKIYIGERIRDIIYLSDQKLIIMFLESTASIGIINLKQ